METAVSKAGIWNILELVKDPEIPVLSIVDLGVVRDVIVGENDVEILITPTYSGCPAMNAIETEIRMVMSEHRIPARVRLVLSPAWTTDWMSAKGREKLKAYGIAPPVDEEVSVHTLFGRHEQVPCPLCNSVNTEMISQFGSTACKSLYRCKDCLEPFDYFKCLK